MKSLHDPAVPGVNPEMPTDGRAGKTPELRELRYFYHVARTGSFSRAARELNVTQPSVTTQVQKLEQGFGTQLLIRHGRGITLTAAGTSLMDRLDLIFGLLNAPLQPAIVPEQAPGTVSLALPPEAAPLLVPRLLEACEARFPHVKLTIEVGISASLEEWVLDRRVDIAVLQDPPQLDELDLDPVLTERLGLVADVRDTSLDGIEVVRFRQLAGLKLILPHPRHWMRRLIEDAAFRRGIFLQEVLQADDVSLVKEMVRHGLGFAILPCSVVRAELARGSLSFLPIEHEALATMHTIASRRDFPSAPLVHDVRLVLRDVMSDLVRSGHWAGATVTGTSSRNAATPPGQHQRPLEESVPSEPRQLRVG